MQGQFAVLSAPHHRQTRTAAPGQRVVVPRRPTLAVCGRDAQRCVTDTEKGGYDASRATVHEISGASRALDGGRRGYDKR
ncbi:hypothetical protein ON010_g3204 [Phytophthora cinnamomi]|nr:hypothetical protein ON010_g3204 [Phytophthora cinnamomi]